MNLESKKSFLINFLYLITVAAVIYFVCRFLLGILLPFVIGTIIAWIVQKPAGYLKRKTGIKKENWAPVLAIFLYISVIALVIILVYLIFYVSVGFFSNMPKYMISISGFLNDFKIKMDGLFDEIPNDFKASIDTFYDSTLSSFLSKLTSLLSNTASSIAKKAPVFLLSSVVSAVASCYIAKDFIQFAKFLKQMCGKTIYKNILKVKIIFTESILRFLKGYILLMLITFVEIAVGLFILRVKYALLLALLISIVDILPVLGTGTILVPWAIIELIAGNEFLGIGIILMYIFITVIRNFLEPKIIGKQMGINPIFTLLTMFIGIKLFGIAGIIILPVTFIVVFKYYKNELEQESGRFI